MDDEEGICRGGTRHALSGVLSPSVYMGVDVVGTACEGSDNTVLGRCSSTGGLGVLVEIVLFGLPINRGKFIRVDEEVEEG